MKPYFPPPLLLLVMLTGTSRSAVLANGDFEISGAGNPTFTGWSELTNDASIDPKTTAAIIGGATISGSGTIEMVALATNGGAVRQSVASAMTQFTVSLEFASLSPETSADASTRYFSMQLKHGISTSTTQINLRVAKSGQLQAYDGANWQAIGTLSAVFSTDTGTLGSWSSETVVANSLTVTADYSGAPTYSVNLNGTTVSGLSHFQGGVPGGGTNTLTNISFNGVASAKNFLVDNVVVVPEPGTSGLLAAAGLGVFLRRRPDATACTMNPLKSRVNHGNR